MTPCGHPRNLMESCGRRTELPSTAVLGRGAVKGPGHPCAPSASRRSSLCEPHTSCRRPSLPKSSARNCWVPHGPGLVGPAVRVPPGTWPSTSFLGLLRLPRGGAAGGRGEEGSGRLWTGGARHSPGHAGVTRCRLSPVWPILLHALALLL